jgi:NAD(P)-dependent dehydrogenase (short-subunit alcohol dehydrogenase family)
MTQKPNTLSGQHVLVIGGSSGIGLAVAKLAKDHGANVTIAARDASKLAEAAKHLGANISTKTVDLNSDESVSGLFKTIGKFDHLAMTGPAPGFGAFGQTTIAQARADFDAKFWGQYSAAYHAVNNGLSKQGSITLMSGAYSARPVAGASTLAAVQAGLEGLARGIAVDLAPLRVNAVSPGLTDTPLIRGLFGNQAAEDIYRQTAETLPARRITTSEDIAELYLFLMSNKSMTGSTLFPDGGYTLR